MVEFEEATPEDTKTLARASKRAFEYDIHYGAPEVGGPPGYKSDRWQRKMMQIGHYYKIMVDGQIIGRFIIFEKKDGHYELGRIFVEPACQNGGVGAQAIRFMEAEFSTAKKWTLDTPRWAVRNRHFYQKMGYLQVEGENSDFVSYEKQMVKTG